MKVSKILIEKVKSFEGCRLVAYQDAAGKWTIGYGSTINVSAGMRITQEEANKRLEFDLETAAIGVNRLGLSLTQGQFDALVDFAYNLGIGNLKSSTLLKKIKQKADVSAIKKEFLRWNKAGGKVLAGLTERRKWESNRWEE